MERPFHQRRRQQFLTQAYFDAADRHYAKNKEFWATNRPEADSPLQAASLVASIFAEDAYQALSIHYTAGEPIEPLRAQLEQVVAAYEGYQKARASYEEIPDISPLGLGLPDEYERLMQILGLGVLLHRPDLIVRMAALIDPRYKGEDALYEDLLAYYMDGRIDIDEWFHPEPYTPLIHAIYEDDDKAAAAKLNAYCKGWYPAFENRAPWHDSHLRINGTDGDYFGYWAFEAGAVALLCDIDDSAVTHTVYPKDLVAWARANKHLSQTEAGKGDTRLRCPASEPCPRTGWWHTPAKPGHRQHFEQGQVMPSVQSDYGATIWQWAERQD